MRRPARGWLVSVLAVAAVLLLWWAGTGQPAGDDAPASDDRRTSARGDVDPHSGLAWVAVEDLPPQAGQVLRLIDAGGPFPYDRDGAVFENRERILPLEERGHYREYTVETPGSRDRGARRIVTGADDELYWTQDHYRSFERIAR